MCTRQSHRFVSSSPGVAWRRTILSHEYQTVGGLKDVQVLGKEQPTVLMLIGCLKSRSRVVSSLTSCQSNFRRISSRALASGRTFRLRGMKVKLNSACTRYVFSPAGRRSLRTFVVCTYMSRSPSTHAYMPRVLPFFHRFIGISSHDH